MCEKQSFLLNNSSLDKIEIQAYNSYVLHPAGQALKKRYGNCLETNSHSLCFIYKNMVRRDTAAPCFKYRG